MTNIRTQSGRSLARRDISRRGLLSLELVLVLPILLMVVLAAVQYGILIVASQAVSAAAAVGAREASLPSASPATVTAAVDKALQTWNFASSLDPVGIEVNGEPESSMPLADADTGDTVAVTVSVDSVAAAPNLLKFIGIDLEGQKLLATIVMRKE